MTKKLENMTDEELVAYRNELNEKKLAIKVLEREADEQLEVRVALKGLPENVKRIILEGQIGVTGELATKN
jgi:hypothetical protein